MITKSPLSAREAYQAKLSDAESAIAELQVQHQKMIWIRTVLFVAAAVLLFLGYGNVGSRFWLLTAGWLSAGAFFVAIVRHEHLRLSKLGHESHERLFKRLLARLDRRWEALPAQHLLPQYADLACADDLDVAGGASLLSLLSLAGTTPGKAVLQGWLADNATWSSVQERQAAAQKLTDCRELRLSMIQTVGASGDGSEDVYGLPKWAESENWLAKNRLAHALSYFGPALIAIGTGLIALYFLAGRPSLLSNMAIGFLGGGLLVNILVTVFWGSWIHDIFQQVTGTRQAFQFAEVFAACAALPTDAGLLDKIRDAATASDHSATAGFKKLLKYVRLANLQRDPLAYILYLALQLLFLWDFRILKLMESWKAKYGPHVSQWFEALGTCEAILSTATLADENRDWTYPRPPQDPSLLLDAEALGHPLLSDASRVKNDLQLTREQPLLLVTGSNMAGKSTFLRALGLNLLLARTGAPVCSSGLATPLFELATSIRVRDSLRDGVSFFMAELRRLKEVVDMAATRDGSCENPILFLLDEILQGTNSRERQLAVATVVERLVGFGACGALSTHDLELADVEDVKRVSQIVHFREFFEFRDGREVMRFDYVMRPGSTPTTNALKLLTLVGLQEDPGLVEN